MARLAERIRSSIDSSLSKAASRSQVLGLTAKGIRCWAQKLMCTRNETRSAIDIGPRAGIMVDPNIWTTRTLRMLHTNKG